MAVSNIVRINEFEVIKNESVSLTSAAGEGTSSYRSVPSGKYWILTNLRAYNGEAGDRKISFILADADGTAHGCLSNGPLARNTVATLEEAAWDGRVIVPENWRIYAKWHGMTGGSTVNWQYIAVERSNRKGLNIPNILAY